MPRKLIVIAMLFLATTGFAKKKWYKCGTKYDATAQMPAPCGNRTRFIAFQRCYQLTEDEANNKKIGPAGARRDCGDACEKPLQEWKSSCERKIEKNSQCPPFPGFTTVSEKSYQADPSKLQFVCRHEWCNKKKAFTSEAICKENLSTEEEIGFDDELVPHRTISSETATH